MKCQFNIILLLVYEFGILILIAGVYRVLEVQTQFSDVRLARIEKWNLHCSYQYS